MKNDYTKAELILYREENQATISLSSAQLMAVFKILGIEFQANSYKFFSDSAIEQLFQMKGNPLKLQPANDGS